MPLANESLIVILVVGLIAGWLAGKFVQGSGLGVVTDILLGVAGAVVANLLFPKLNILRGYGLAADVIYAAAGAIVLLLVMRLVQGDRAVRSLW